MIMHLLTLPLALEYRPQHGSTQFNGPRNTMHPKCSMKFVDICCLQQH